MISQSPLIWDEADFIKHILTKHDGEARIIFDDGYEPLPGGVDFHDACFWRPPVAISPLAQQ